MFRNRRPNGTQAIDVQLVEWDRKGPAQNRRLEGTSLLNDASAQRLADQLRSQVDIREGYQGLQIETTSFVGRIDLGPLRIAIQPKLSGMPLARLVRYAYGLRDVQTVEETRTPTIRYGLHDLLILMLIAEVEELLQRGLARQYISLSEKLESPRGRILIDEVVRQGGLTDARLPCQHFERHVNWHLNQVLRAGLAVAAGMTEDRDLRWRAHRLAAKFGDVKHIEKLDIDDIDRAERSLTRLTEANASALTIIRLLQNMRGLAFEPVEELSRMPGFLFDMNYFFQRLLSRFLRENLTGQRIADERAISKMFVYAPDANPQRRVSPKPRPDYALLRADKLCAFLDAKYRDVWDNGLPAEWLYQLSTYALASPSQVSVLLYASMAPGGREERVEIHRPIQFSGEGLGSVIVRPVSLRYLGELLDPERRDMLATERQRFANGLVVLNTHTSVKRKERSEVQAA
jgi:5-methylcytosine-specific restriction enzyme subunit McrC